MVMPELVKLPMVTLPMEPPKLMPSPTMSVVVPVRLFNEPVPVIDLTAMRPLPLADFFTLIVNALLPSVPDKLMRLIGPWLIFTSETVRLPTPVNCTVTRSPLLFVIVVVCPVAAKAVSAHKYIAITANNFKPTRFIAAPFLDYPIPGWTNAARIF